MRRSASTPKLFSLIREHDAELRLICLVRQNAMVETPLTAPRLRGQDMSRKGVPSNDFSRSGLLEAFGRTLMCL